MFQRVQTLLKSPPARDRKAAVKDEDALRSHFDGAGANVLDAYPWLLLMAGHTARHVAQNNEVKSDPIFPK